MKIPSKLTIYSKKWNVSYRWRLLDENKLTTDCWVDPENATIWLDRALTREEKFKELLRAIPTAVMYELNAFKTGGVRDEHAGQTLALAIASTYQDLFTIRFKDK